MTSRCDFCGLMAQVTLHPVYFQRLICSSCKHQEILYRKSQLEEWTTSSKKHVPTFFTKQLENLDSIERHSVNIIKQLTYKALQDKLLAAGEFGRFDYQGEMV